MKIKILLTGAVLLAALLVSGCTVRAPVVPPVGFLFTNYKAPLMVHYGNTDVAKREGRGETQYIREPFLSTAYGFGNAGIAKIASDAGLNEVDYVDYEYLNVLGIYQQVQIIPHGK